MKKLVLGLLVLAFFRFAVAEEKYEITEVDIFSLGRPLFSAQVSVYGVSLGDSMEEALAKVGKKSLHVKYNHETKCYNLDMGEHTWRIISPDNKTVQSIVLLENFSSCLKGKTAKYFDGLSEGSLKSFVEKCFGEPDYVYPWYDIEYGKNIPDFVADLIAKQERGEELNVIEKDTLETFQEMQNIDKLLLKASESLRLYRMYYVEKGFVFSGTSFSNTIELTTKERIFSGFESNVGFRDALWGMNKERVKKVETSEFVKEEKMGGDFKGLDALLYKAEVGRLEAVIVYYFAKNLLTRARYKIMESHTNMNLFIEDFEYIMGQLTQKFGPPERDDAIWLNDLYKDDPSEYGMAMSVGHLMYVAEWYPPKTTIYLSLTGDNYEINLSIEYTSDAFSQFEKKVREKAKRDIW